MQFPSRKQCWVGGIFLLVVVGTLSLPPVRLQYHKWRLEGIKERKSRLLARDLSAIDRFWLALGNPVSGQELDDAVRRHEKALVRLGFLAQENLPAKMVAECPSTVASLQALNSECPWYHAETLAETNLVITACPKMLVHWRERARELGWIVPKS